MSTSPGDPHLLLPFLTDPVLFLTENVEDVLSLKAGLDPTSPGVSLFPLYPLNVLLAGVYAVRETLLLVETRFFLRIRSHRSTRIKDGVE